jgi:KDO2-lipid IV(A) lauroyltransferase
MAMRAAAERTVRAAKRLRIRAYQAGEAANRRLRRARRHAARLRRRPFRRHVVELAQRLEAVGIPARLPYRLGAPLLSALWRPAALRGLLVANLARRHPYSPLVLAGGPHGPDEERRWLAANHFGLWRAHALARCPRAVFDRYVRVTGREHLEKARAAGRGVIVVSAHYGASAALPVALTRLGFDPACMWAALGPAPEGVRLIRPRRGERLMLRPLVEARGVLVEGGMLVMMGDGNFGARNVEVPLLDGAQRFAPGFATLALTTGAIVVPAFAAIGSDQAILLEFLEPLAVAEAGGRADRIRGLIAGFASTLERRLVADPALFPGNWALPSTRTWTASALRAARDAFARS